MIPNLNFFSILVMDSDQLVDGGERKCIGVEAKVSLSLIINIIILLRQDRVQN